MIKIPLNDILGKIKEKTAWSDQEVDRKLKQKMDQLAGLISKEGAAHIIANEQGIKLLEQTSGRLKIKNVLSGMRNVEIVGRVIDVYEVREFQKEDRSGKVGSFIVGDETSSVRVVLWGSQTDNILKLEKNMVVRIKGSYAKDNQGRKELHLGESGMIELNPADEVVGEVKQRRDFSRKPIKDLAGNENDVELMGTIVQCYDLKFFEVCPTCNKRARQLGENYMCEEHGQVTPVYSYVFNVFMDDGSGSIRIVFFRNQLQNLLKKTNEEIVGYRNFADKFENIKHELLGKIIKLRGKASVNEKFGRAEFIAQFVDPDPHPDEELARLKNEPIPPKMEVQTSEDIVMQESEDKENQEGAEEEDLVVETEEIRDNEIKDNGSGGNYSNNNSNKYTDNSNNSADDSSIEKIEEDLQGDNNQ